MTYYLVNTEDQTIKEVPASDVPEIAGMTQEEYVDIYMNDATRINGDLDNYFFFYDYETAKSQFEYCN